MLVSVDWLLLVSSYLTMLRDWERMGRKRKHDLALYVCATVCLGQLSQNSDLVLPTYREDEMAVSR